MSKLLPIVLWIIFPLLISCNKGALIADPYWVALMKMQGENPKVIAKNANLAYFEISGNTEEDIRNRLLLITKLHRKGQWLILSPWMQKFIPDLDKEHFHIGVLNMQALPVLPAQEGIRQTRILRTQILEHLLETLNQENAQIILLYNSLDDFNIFTQNIKDKDNLFAIYVGSQEEVQHVEQNARTILSLRDIKAMFILAEPYNYALWLQLENDVEGVEKIYSSGVRAENKKFYLLNDNVNAQIQALLYSGDLDVQAQLKK